MNSYSRRRRSNLNTLRISLESEAESLQGKVSFELIMKGEGVERAEVSYDEVGLPKNLKDLRDKYSEPQFSVPDHVIKMLHQALAKWTTPNELLWLELNPPGSSLSIVPWERLLQQPLNARLLRLSFFPTSSFPRGDSVDIVICASAPLAKEAIPISTLIPEVTKHILDSQTVQTTIHIFSDRDSYSALKQNLNAQIQPEGHGVRLYNPASAAEYEPAERSKDLSSEPMAVTNPWLLWMIDALSGQTVDLVHFVCHGFFYADQGALALAESPTLNVDTRWARFIGARQLNAFLDRVGAYSVAFCSPEHNFSTVGLRLLTEQMARCRPGLSLMHDYSGDPYFKDLCDTYHALYSDAGTELISSSSVTIYCSPGMFKRTPGVGLESFGPGAGLESFAPESFSPTVRPPAIKEKGPWVASGVRWLERTAASQLVNEDVTSEAQASTNEAISESVKFVKEIIEQYGLKE